MARETDDPADARRRRASMREVAERAHVAISSVSRVLSGHPDVSRSMRERVMSAVRELDYEPDYLAQSLRRGATLSIGFVIGSIANPLMADIVHGAEAVLRRAGYSILLVDSEGDPEIEAAHIRLLASRRVDGMILSLASERSPETLAVLRGLEQPFVVVDRELPAELGASAVLSDHRAGLTEAVEHLIGLGHRRIALIAGPLDVRPGYARLDALRAALAERTPDAEPIHLCGPFSPDFGERATYALLDRPRPPTAIVVGSNVLLVGCLRALAARRLAIPGDVSLVTCDDVPLAELHSPPLSAVARDTEALGRTAAELLLRRLRDEAGPERVVLPTRFVARASTGAPAERTDRHTEED